MAKSSTTLKSGDRLPPRGRDKRTLILEAIRERALLGSSPDESQEVTEKRLFGYMAEQALTNEDSATRNMCLGAILDRGWAKLKPTSEKVVFEYNENATPLDNVNGILGSVANGQLAPDVAKDLIGAVKDLIAINEHTELLERIKSIEDKLK